MSRSFQFALDEFYHSYGRGTEKRKIFLNRKDYERFVALLYVANNEEPIHLSDYQNRKYTTLFDISRTKPLVAIGAYTLMPNHFHILMREIREGGISLFMQKLMTGYTMYFNKKYERTGSLFESRFKAEHVSSNRHLEYLYSYIHLNPVKIINPKWRETGIKDKHKTLRYLSEYPYSSYSEYTEIGNRPEGKILSKDSFPDYFGDSKVFSKEIFRWLSLSRLNLDKLEV